MKCAVPGCSAKLGKETGKVTFHKLLKNDVFMHIKEKDWKRAFGPKKTLKSAHICSRHLDFGAPLAKKSDEGLSNIITNIPEVTEEFDVPDYVTLDDERKVELDVIHKYITNPVCDENGYYINDHDYLGLPIIRIKTEIRPGRASLDHNYSINPACFYSDLRHFCNICERNTPNLFSFNSHMMIHTLENFVVCHICRQNFLTTTCLNTHLSTHKAVCEVCGSEVPTVQLKTHQQAYKKQKKKIDAGKIPDSEKINFCIYCMESFKEDSRKHSAKHTLRRKRGRKKKNQVQRV